MTLSRCNTLRWSVKYWETRWKYQHE